MQDLPSTTAAAESLVDFRQSKALTEENRKSQHQDNGKKERKDDRPKSRRKEQKRKGETPVTKKQQAKSIGCFICDGPHRARNYLKREKLSALVKDSTSGEDDSAAHALVNPIQLCLNTLGKSLTRWWPRLG